MISVLAGISEGIFVLEPREFWIEIEIVVQIDF